MAGIQFTKSDWDEEVLKSDIPVLVDFGLHGVLHAGWYRLLFWGCSGI